MQYSIDDVTYEEYELYLVTNIRELIKGVFSAYLRISEEPDEGKLQVRFCEEYGKSLTLIDRGLFVKG